MTYVYHNYHQWSSFLIIQLFLLEPHIGETRTCVTIFSITKKWPNKWTATIWNDSGGNLLSLGLSLSVLMKLSIHSMSRDSVPQRPWDRYKHKPETKRKNQASLQVSIIFIFWQRNYNTFSSYHKEQLSILLWMECEERKYLLQIYSNGWDKWNRITLLPGQQAVLK